MALLKILWGCYALRCGRRGDELCSFHFQHLAVAHLSRIRIRGQVKFAMNTLLLACDIGVLHEVLKNESRKEKWRAAVVRFSDVSMCDYVVAALDFLGFAGFVAYCIDDVTEAKSTVNFQILIEDTFSPSREGYMTRFTLFSSQLLPCCPPCGTVAMKATEGCSARWSRLRRAREATYCRARSNALAEGSTRHPSTSPPCVGPRGSS